MILGVMIFTCREVVLQIHLEVTMLCPALAQEIIGYVTFLGVIPHKQLFCIC
jgi:hypothetical protein